MRYSFFELCDSFIFSGRKCIHRIDHRISELIHFVHDLSDDSLVREVLFGCQGDQCLDQSPLLSMGGNFSLNLPEGHVEFADFREGRVCETAEEIESGVDGAQGGVVFGLLLGEFGSLLFSDKLNFSLLFPICFLILLELLDLISDLGSSGLQQVLNGVVGPLNVNHRILNLDLEASHLRVVLVGPDAVLVLELTEFVA